MWLENLKELKKAKGASCKQIADGALLPERTVVRIFAGETPNPTTSTLYRIVHFLGGSLDDIFAEGTFVIGTKNLKMLQEELDAVTAERDALVTENQELRVANGELTAENARLKMTLEHKEELLALHKYYTKAMKGAGVLK